MTKGQRTIIAALAVIAFCVLCSLGGVLMYFVPTGNPEVVQVESITKEIPLASPTPAPTCTKLRFARMLGPDDVDTMIGEGEVLHSSWRIVARFDCPRVSPDDISFKWYYNDSSHCTHTYISESCDNSSLTHWDSLPEKFLISLQSKDFPEDISPGKYTLVIFVNGREATRGTVTMNP